MKLPSPQHYCQYTRRTVETLAKAINEVIRENVKAPNN